MLDAIQNDMLVLKRQLGVMFPAIPMLPEIGPFVAARISKGYGPDHLWRIALELIAIFAGASAGEALARRLFRPLHQLLPMLDQQSEFGKLGALLVNGVIRLLQLGAFGLTGVGLFFAVYEGHEAARYAFWSLFFLVVLVRAVGIALRILLAPSLPGLRLPELDDRTARRLYYRLIMIAALVIGAGLTSTFFYLIDLPTPLHLASAELMLFVATAGLITVVWVERRSIARMVGARGGAGEAHRHITDLFAAHWHVFISCLLVTMAIVASVDRLVTGERQAARIFETLGALIGFLLIDGLLRMAVRRYFAAGEVRPDAVTGALLEGATDQVDLKSGAASFDRRRAKEAAGTAYGAVILRNARIALTVLAMILMSRIWSFELSGFGSGGLGARIAEALFQIIVTLLLASSAWSIAKIAINRHLPHETLDALALATDEVSGTGLSRFETLLPLIRMFLFVTIITMAVMSVVSAMGVNIGPLLAGAGIVGVAIGFGSQTLVRDVLSGIFFLFDDAFRIGEYIDVGEGKGTVERMSIRALMLRHQLGQIYTIPFGAIRRVVNYSRDWMIMKLELRVPFETDLDRLKKVVKQAGAELMADPEYGSMFLQPLKSQGVHHIDDSALVVRVKFMAKPSGDAFVLRRQVFQKIQEAFQQNGLEFASQRVVVETADGEDAPAAALAVLPATDERRSRA